MGWLHFNVGVKFVNGSRTGIRHPPATFKWDWVVCDLTGCATQLLSCLCCGNKANNHRVNRGSSLSNQSQLGQWWKGIFMANPHIYDSWSWLSNCFAKWLSCWFQLWLLNEDCCTFKSSSHALSKWALVSQGVSLFPHTNIHLLPSSLSLPHLVWMSHFFVCIPLLTPLSHFAPKPKSHLPQYIFFFIFPCWARKSCLNLQPLLGELQGQEPSWEDLVCPDCKTHPHPPGCSRPAIDNLVCWCWDIFGSSLFAGRVSIPMERPFSISDKRQAGQKHRCLCHQRKPGGWFGLDWTPTR